MDDSTDRARLRLDRSVDLHTDATSRSQERRPAIGRSLARNCLHCSSREGGQAREKKACVKIAGAESEAYRVHEDVILRRELRVGCRACGAAAGF
jgi:hypothetical protein